MRRIADLVGQDLQWSQPSAMRMEYELRAAGELAATLRFRSMFGTFATGESGDGCWTFKRVGFWQTRVSIRLCGSDADVATFRNNTWSGGGSLEFEDGRQFRATTNFWNTSLDFNSGDDEPLVRLRRGGVFHLSGPVEILTKAAPMSELPLLVLTSWYLAVMLSRDSGGGAAAAAAAG